MAKLTVNEQAVEVDEGATVLDACRKAGVEVPTLCYSRFLEPYGACRMCTIKVSDNGSSRLATSCRIRFAGLDSADRSD